MTRSLTALTFAVLLGATPLAAEETAPPSLEEGFSLLGEGMALIMRALESEMAPMIAALAEAIDDVNAFEAPEVLENGDIIIRRKVPLAPEEGIDPETGATDL